MSANLISISVSLASQLSDYCIFFANILKYRLFRCKNIEIVCFHCRDVKFGFSGVSDIFYCPAMRLRSYFGLVLSLVISLRLE